MPKKKKERKMSRINATKLVWCKNAVSTIYLLLHWKKLTKRLLIKLAGCQAD